MKNYLSKLWPLKKSSKTTPTPSSIDPYQRLINSLNYAIKTNQPSLRLDVGAKEFSNSKRFCQFYFGLKQNNPGLKFDIYGGINCNEYLMFDLKNYDGPRDQEIKLVFEDRRVIEKTIPPPVQASPFQKKREAFKPQNYYNKPQKALIEGNLYSFNFENSKQNKEVSPQTSNNVLDFEAFKAKRSK